MYLTTDFLTEINNTITGWNNITSRKVNVKPYEFDKMYMDKDQIENKLYEIIDEFNLIFINETRPFYDGNGITCKILFSNDDEIIKLIDKKKKIFIV